MSKHKTLFFLLLLVAIICLWQLGTCSLHNAENRWAAVAHGMYESGNIFIMQIGKQDYYDKPFLSYWLILLCSYVAGGVSEGSVRFPSALAGIIAVLLTYLLAARMLGKRVAWLSAGVFMTSLGFVHWARHGQVEMLNLLGIMAVIYIFLRCKEAASPGWLYVMATFMAVGSWLKGPLCYAVPGFAILVYSLAFKDWKWLSIGHVTAAGLFSLLLYFSPFVLAWQATGKWDALYMVYRENVLRLLEPFDHVKPLSYYIPSLPLNSLPWSILLPWVIWYLAQNWRTVAREVKQLLAISAGCLLFFALSSSRRHYYLIPLLPFVSIMFGVFLAALPDLSKKWQKSIACLWLVIGGVWLLALPVVLFVSQSFLAGMMETYGELEETSALHLAGLLTAWPVRLTAVVMAVAGMCLSIAAIQTLRRHVAPWHLPVFVATIYVAMFLAYGVITTQMDQLRGQREFIRTLVRHVPVEREIAIFTSDGQENTSMVFYLACYRQVKEYRTFCDIQIARQELAKNGGFLLTEDILPDETDWQKVDAQNYVKFKAVKGRKKDIWTLYRPR
jgi:4-amino-4-deoxy-L-arabinose transferase-like glycosyltransferase